MEEKINIQQINPITFEYQEYSNEDLSLISSTNVDVNFDPSTDYIEYFVYTLNGDLVINLAQGYRNYTLIDNLVSIDPAADLKNVGLTNGTYNSVYNFLSNKLGSSQFNTFYIQDISQDRTELRLNSINILDAELSILTPEFISEITSNGDYIDFALNFGSNQLVIANNILLDSSNPDDLSILIKLYEPLPSDFNIKSECWIVKEVAESIAYNVLIEQIFNTLDEGIQLKGPNINLSIKDQINNSTVYSDYSSLTSTSTSQGSGSFHYQINSILADKGIELNIDYSNYSNFINFSSAQTRVENFYYKLSLIEEYNYSASLSSGTNTNYYISSSNNIWQDKINEIITGFDGYEYYLYYESGSTCWPKSNTEPPYVNEPTTSLIGQTWLISQSAVALSFDKENNNALINSIPEYLRDDPSNNQYELFIEMIGQHFDNIFIYLQDVTEKYNADNRLNYGVSKDLVADILRDMGIKIYQNNFSSDDLYSALLGFTPSGSLFNIPYTTGSLPTPEGWEYIDTYITASATGSLYPTDDINISIYKRIYHNLPYLLKKKGTVEGLRALITLYGLPDTILRVNEFGGKDKNNQNDWDFWYNQYDYQYNTLDSGYITTDWVIPSWNSEDSVPQTVEFRFKTPGLDSALTTYSQSLWCLDADINLVLEYTGSGYTSGSYSGSIPDPENEYATLKFITNSTSASIYLPFFDGGWWAVAVTRTGSDFNLFAGNNIYTGEEGSSIGFTGSDSLTSAAGATEWGNGTVSTFASASLYPKFSGSLQEIRYYNQPLSQSVFNDYVMNYNSIEGNGTNSSANQLAFRASLGGELYTGSSSIHPKVTGSYVTESFSGGNSFTINGGDFSSKEEYVYFDQFPAGIKNRISDKIKQVNTILPYSGSDSNTPNSSSLSPFISVQQTSYASENYTRDIDYVEVAFSPQNEINDDIIDSLGYFNIGDYIGDPRQVSSSAESYPDLDALRDIYFEKYSQNYNWWDYIRLIKYLDNSLFKMLKDWVPARTDLASGIVIKQHLLERNKYPVPQVNQSQEDNYTASISMYTITGSNGGTMPNLNGEISGSGPGFNIVPITQSWTGSTPSLLGEVPFTHTSQTEFFDGELSGSVVEVENGELNEFNPYKTPSTLNLYYNTTGSTNTNPGPGEIYWNFKQGSTTGTAFPVFYNADYVYVVYINEVDKNSNDIQNALSNLSSGDEITLTVKYTLSPPGIPLTKTITTPILNITPVSQFVWRITLPFTGYSGNTTINSNSLTTTTGFSNYANSPVYLNPFLNYSTNYDTSEFNPLIDNAVNSRLNNHYYDVDYSSGQIVATNAENIISASQFGGVATPSTVVESNYTTARVINPRYNGSKNTANMPNFNEGSENILPPVESDGTYFAYFDWIGGTSYELIDKCAAHILFLVDSNANTYTPNLSSSYYYNLIDSFNANGNNANVIFKTSDGNINSLVGTRPVIKPGALPYPIVYTQFMTGSDPTYTVSTTNTMSFDTGITENYNINGILSSDIYDSTSTHLLNINSLNSGSTYTTGSIAGSTDWIKVITSSAEVVNVSAQLSVNYTYTEYDFNNPTTIQWIIEKSSNNGSTWSTYATTGRYVNAGSTYTNTISGPFEYAQSGSMYRAKLSITTTGGNELIDINSGNLVLVQDPPTSISINGTFFTTGSSSLNILTGSKFTQDVYENIQTSPTSSGTTYSTPNLPFVLEVGDEIRFGGSENQVYGIIGVESPKENSLNTLYITLDHNITPGTNINSFFIRRYIPNANFVVLDAFKDNTVGGGSGFLMPEYASNDLTTKFDEIIKNLTEKGLI